jgi:predicted double-glycine peptidase
MSKRFNRGRDAESFASRRTAMHSLSPRAIYIPVPNIRAQTPFTCGAAVLLAVCRFFGRGPEAESECVAVLRQHGFSARVGVHPRQMERAARTFGLEANILRDMDRHTLLDAIKRRIPVLLTLQAWAEGAKEVSERTYATTWDSGHWVIAIGFDKNGIVLEDPWLEASRGYLSFESLAARWHDTEEKGRHYFRTGVLVWASRPTKSAYLSSGQILG